jgi:flagellar biosynthesis protein FlhG
MKVLSLKYSGKACKLIVNMVRQPEEGREVFRQLQLVTDRFLDISIEYLGYVLFDDKVTKGIKSQKIVSELFPDTSASRCFTDISRRISTMSSENFPEGGSNLFWRHLV